MLDQLVESKDTFKGLRTLLLIVTIIMILSVAGVFGKFLWDLNSLFGFFKGGGMSGDLELTSLVAPVPVTEDEPPPVEEKVEEVKKIEQNVDTRKVLMLDTSQSTKIPDVVSVQKNTTKTVRDLSNTIQSNTDSDARNLRTNPNEQISVDKDGVQSSSDRVLVEEDEGPKLTKSPAPTVAATPKPIPRTVSGGVVNGKARNLVTPQYPSAARAVRASGQVSVAVTIDENGNVISASAVSGHTLLRSAAESAARSSKFNPTLLSGQPVKVTGTIIYNFVP